MGGGGGGEGGRGGRVRWSKCSFFLLRIQI